MTRHISRLRELGISEIDARTIVLAISQDAYEDGYREGQLETPTIIGETLGQSGMDFFQWWETQIS
ncbi:MAG: hypothetical protein ACOC3V_03195 [bacterium]